MTIREDARVIGWPLTLLFLPALLWRYQRGADPVKDYYHRLEVQYDQDIFAFCKDCDDMTYQRQVVWVLPYQETRECPCGAVTEIG